MRWSGESSVVKPAPNSNAGYMRQRHSLLLRIAIKALTRRIHATCDVLQQISSQA